MSFTIELEELKEDLEGNEEFASETPEIEEPLVVEDNTGELQELMAMESLLNEKGLVDRAFAESVSQYLPKTTTVSSYTKHPTKVNYGMTQEFIGSAIKMVATVGIVAALGMLGVIAYRMVKRQRALPKIDLSRKVMGAFASVETKFEGLVTSLTTKFSQIKHPQITWKRDEAAKRSAIGSSARVIECSIASGKYPFMSPKLVGASIEHGEKTIGFIRDEIMPVIRNLNKMGTDDDINAISSKVDGFAVGDNLVSSLKDYLQSVGASEGTMANYKDVLLTNADENLIGSSFKDVKFTEVDTKSIAKLNRINEDAQGFYKELDSLTKELERKEGQTASNYASKLKELVGKVKVPLGALDDVLHLREIESNAYDRVTKIMSGAISDGFNFVKSQYESLAQTDKGNAKLYGECIKELRATFDDVKSSIK